MSETEPSHIEPPEPTVPETEAEPTRPADSIGTDMFLEAVRSQLPDVAAGRSATDLSAVADRACEQLADGAAADRVIAETRSLGTLDAEATDEATARELVKLAIDTVCVEQAPRVDEF